MRRLIRAAVERPVSTLTAAAVLVVLGLASLARLPVSLLPALERPRLAVAVTAPEASREELLERVVEPLERRLRAVPGVRSQTARIGDGAARLELASEWQTDPDRLRIDVERRLAGLDLPPGVRLSVELAAADASPLLEVAVLGGSGGARTAYVRRVLVPELARLPGAGRVEAVGMAPLHAVVRPRAAALAARDLTAADLVERLRPLGLAIAAGRAREGAEIRPLLVRESVTSLEDLRRLRLPGGGFLGDVAEVALEEVADGSRVRLDGRDGALVEVYRAPEANAVALARRVRSRLAALATRRPPGIDLVAVGDRSGEVVSALAELGLAALIGLLCGTLALRYFLGRWRPTLALAAVIPAATVATFAAFFWAGIALDLVSLAGLALAAGLLVDGSIVVLEAVESARADGVAEPAIEGTARVALAVVAGFVTTAVVFVPLLYLDGLARALFGVQAFALVASLALALALSLTVTPVLAGGRGAAGTGRHPGRGSYLALLDLALARPWAVVALTAAAVALGALAAARLPRELMPEAPRHEVEVRYRLPPELALEAAAVRAAVIETAVAAAAAEPAAAPPRRLAVQWPVARSVTAPRQADGRIVLRFADPVAAAAGRRRVAAAVARLPGVDARAESRGGALVEAVEESGRRLEVIAAAATGERAAALAGRAAEALLRAGLRPAALAGERPRPALRLVWDRQRLARLGVEPASLEAQVRDGLGGIAAGRADLPGVEPEIVVAASTPETPELMPLVPRPPAASPPAGALPLGALAELRAELRPAAVERHDGRPAVRRIYDDGGSGLLRRLDTGRLLAALPLAADERLSPGGAALELVRSFAQLRLALALSLLLVFLTVAALYESFRLPLAVMATVPVALAGAAALLAAAGESLNVLSFLGLIVLTGIVVNNSIVLLHRSEQRRLAGQPAVAAVRAAAAERYRPILLTTLTTLAGMLPLALVPGDGAELRRALALAVTGGLAAGTVASLLVVPVLYRWLAPRRRSGEGG